MEPAKEYEPFWSWDDSSQNETSIWAFRNILLLVAELQSEIRLSVDEWNEQGYFMSGTLGSMATVNFMVAGRYILEAMGVTINIPFL